jgi:hypothetical protein
VRVEDSGGAFRGQLSGLREEVNIEIEREVLTGAPAGVGVDGAGEAILRH